MKVNIRVRGIIVSAKQKSQMERKLLRIKRYLKDVSPAVIDVLLIDETASERGGIDQCVKIDLILPKEHIHIEEVDDRILRAFVFAHKVLERRVKRYSSKERDIDRRDRGRIKNIIGSVGGAVGGAFGRFGGTVGRIVPRRRKRK
jgi:ribosomal subunit interface protein